MEDQKINNSSDKHLIDVLILTFSFFFFFKLKAAERSKGFDGVPVFQVFFLLFTY